MQATSNSPSGGHGKESEVLEGPVPPSSASSSDTTGSSAAGAFTFTLMVLERLLLLLGFNSNGHLA